MILRPTPIPGAMLIELERHTDERGFFARTWCAREFEAAGLPAVVAQTSISWNARRHTLRGLHWQAAPHGEGKIVRCTRGALFDVIVDVRPASPAYLDHRAFTIDADDRCALFVPPGVAHGFLTLADDTEVAYQMDTEYVPEAAQGARWDDPAFAIPWPARPAVLSGRDATFPDFAPDLAAVGPGRWT